MFLKSVACSSTSAARARGTTQTPFLIGDNDVAGLHRHAAEPHGNAVARAGAAVADRLLDEAPAVDRQVQRLVLVDVAGDAVAHGADEAEMRVVKPATPP